MLDDFVDPSDPDVDLPNSHPCLSNRRKNTPTTSTGTIANWFNT